LSSTSFEVVSPEWIHLCEISTRDVRREDHNLYTVRQPLERRKHITEEIKKPNDTVRPMNVEHAPRVSLSYLTCHPCPLFLLSYLVLFSFPVLSSSLVIRTCRAPHPHHGHFPSAVHRWHARDHYVIICKRAQARGRGCLNK